MQRLQRFMQKKINAIKIITTAVAASSLDRRDWSKIFLGD